ncbi:MAG TPA: DUF2182 domain-containing protein, partial [Rhodopila sp.]|nr:DUF2182 domain-containing protein [Rhodopila sp.]
SWMLIVWQSSAGRMDGAAMASPTMGMRAPLFLMTWAVMMMAMMVPAAAPMIMTFHRIQSSKRQRGEAFVATWVFVAAYMLVWALSGIAAYGGAVAAGTIATRLALPATAVARIGGMMLVAAGIYQLTPWKDRCLTRCRTPLSFIMTSWRDGLAGALRMGFHHGLYCLGCCWLLSAILFPLGIMNITAMAVMALIVFAEKSLPWARPVTRGTAAGLIAYGIAVLAVPGSLPTFMPDGGMVMTAPSMPASGTMQDMKGMGMVMQGSPRDRAR